jgi:hypothetical protein
MLVSNYVWNHLLYSRSIQLVQFISEGGADLKCKEDELEIWENLRMVVDA